MGNKHAAIIAPPSRDLGKDPGRALDRPDKPGLDAGQPPVSPRPPQPADPTNKRPPLRAALQATKRLAAQRLARLAGESESSESGKGILEAELIEKIQKIPSKGFISRYEQLAVLQDSEQLSEAEAQELLSLSDQLEKMAVKRLEALAELARIRGIPLRLLAQEMGIKPIVNA